MRVWTHRCFLTRVLPLTFEHHFPLACVPADHYYHLCNIRWADIANVGMVWHWQWFRLSKTLERMACHVMVSTGKHSAMVETYIGTRMSTRASAHARTHVFHPIRTRVYGYGRVCVWIGRVTLSYHSEKVSLVCSFAGR